MLKSKTSATFIGHKEITEVEVSYSRPLAKGRTIFDGLVPFGKVWRTGANGNTMITFSSDVLIQGTILRQGTYALYTVPGASSWDIIFYSNYSNYGLPRPWIPNDVVLKVSVERHSLDYHTEAMTINLNLLSNSSGELEILWEKTSVKLIFRIPVQTQKESEVILLGGIPETDYYCAAEFYASQGNDPVRALWSISSVIQNNEDLPYFYYWLKSLLDAKTGDWKSAVETARIALDGALKAQNERYSEMIRSSLVEWTAFHTLPDS
ncbi:DUF2911 domain-containing protein [Dyadobacter frigoris]|uniref:DUF2911 domain-containing protein n=1 Tax=Dyadobacter frigoris TaxID=2576211 RepID=A0A4U6D7J7_9BACT|nr:DUF2911 domain-containing protein [Dyadobacter frigoris]TKT93372.1 DUF2911 domain-containing protein [Dyadobacter frigoris]GLU54685.1 hypothetical protein Dfri01_41460 [Dyadobacter frigoris]